MKLLNLFKNKKLNLSINLVENNKEELKFNENADALTQVFNAYSFYGEEKHVFNNKIIEKFFNSDKPNDILAVAISCLGEGSSYRKNAITYFENYLSQPSSQQYFSEWFIYSSLATLYEKEYLFNNAINSLDKLIEIDNDNNIADYTRKGNVLIKQNIDSAILYYEKLKNTNIYLKYKNVIDDAYNDALLKKQKRLHIQTQKKEIKKEKCVQVCDTDTFLTHKHY